MSKFACCGNFSCPAVRRQSTTTELQGAHDGAHLCTQRSSSQRNTCSTEHHIELIRSSTERLTELAESSAQSQGSSRVHVYSSRLRSDVLWRARRCSLQAYITELCSAASTASARVSRKRKRMLTLHKVGRALPCTQ